MKRFSKLFFSFSILLFSCSFSFGQSWIWGRQGKDNNYTGYGEGYGVAADISHNGIISGVLTDDASLSFGSNLLGGYFSTVYTVKYDSIGNVLWAKQSSGNGPTQQEADYSVATDLSNNIFVVGTFSDSITFSPTTLNAKFANAFIVKYDSDGNVLWAQSSITPSIYSYGYGYSVATDKSGNAYMSGGFSDTISFGSYNLYSSGGNAYSVFVVKYNSSGIVKWLRQSLSGGTGQGYYVITCDSYGNVYVAGSFINSLSFGPYHLSSPWYTPFIAKYDSNGNIKWAKQGVCTINSVVNGSLSITTDKSDKIYVTGSFDSTLKFDSYALYSKESTIFITKYDTNGSVIWAKQAYPLDSNRWFGYGISSDKFNHLFFCGGNEGHSNRKLKFGTDTIKMNNANAYASIVAELDTSGNVLCSSIVTDCSDGNNYDGCQIASDPSGEFVYLGGDIEFTAIFNKDTLGPKGFAEWPFISRWQTPYPGETQKINPISFIAQSVSLFPNPNNGKFNIGVSGEEQGPSEVVVYNILGERMFDETLRYTQGDNTINISSQPNGIYLYRISKQDGELIGGGKMVIQK